MGRLLWRPFLSNAPAAGRKRLEKRAQHSSVFHPTTARLSDIETAIGRLISLIHETLRSAGLAQLMPAKPCILELFYDPAAEKSVW